MKGASANFTLSFPSVLVGNQQMAAEYLIQSVSAQGRGAENVSPLCLLRQAVVGAWSLPGVPEIITGLRRYS